jgi:hypothetical protein
MKQDRFLIGILVFIGVLIIAALGLFLFRSRAAAYRPEDTPAGVVYNYVLALQRRDYSRAYGYLADGPSKPSFDQFQQAFFTYQIDPSTSALQVGETQMLSNGDAWVNLTTQYGGGFIDRGYASTNRAALVKQGGAWKIVSLPYPFWGFDWYTPTPLPAKTP